MPRRVLQYNVHASGQFRKHEICWDADGEDTSIREWINAIRGGDAIQIIPKAQYPAWMNFVQKAEIEVHGSETPRDTAESEVPRPIVTPEAAGSHHRACYRHLDEAAHEIRLVFLNPGSLDEPISCSLMYTSLLESQTIPYEALSYFWGDPRHRRDISLTVSGTEEVSQYVLSITSALHSAMKNLRPQTGPARILWIDAICINQANLDERAAQVGLMREIYHQAKRVIVWLGDGDEITQKSIRTINTISDRYEQSRRSNAARSDLVRLHDPLMESLGVDSFVDEWPLFESPWFRRTWVVQEIFNAREAIVCCGEDTLIWPMVLRVNKCIRLSDLKMNSSHKALMPPIYEDLFDYRVATGSTWSTEAGILEVLVKGLDLDATDPRDKIFAMLQFGRETQDLTSLPPELMPDYHKPTAEVFSSFTKWWIVERRSLRILSAIQALEGRTWQETSWGRTSRRAAEQPTWSWWHRGHSNWAIGILGLSTDSPYRAAADTTPDINMIMKCRESSILSLTGIRVGTIERVMPYPYYHPPPHHENLHRAYVSLFDPLNLTGKWIHQLGSKHAQSYMTADDPTLKRGHFSSHFDFSTRTGAVECHSNCFFNTPEGLIGLCPFSARPGDVLVVLYGGPVPYVLRACPDGRGDGPERTSRYEFVGECYLQGYMDGRAIQEQEDKGMPSEVFVLV